MHLEKLIVDNFRCIQHTQFEPAKGMNVLIGNNTSGKTSVLESIFFLGRARSFRSSYGSTLIRVGANTLSVFGRIRSNDSTYSDYGIERDRSDIRWKIDGRRNVNLHELVEALPIQAIDPNIHQLLEEGPTYRRRFLDWGVFHVEQNFYPIWQRFHRALKQRNRALKTSAISRMILVWHAELSECAHKLDDLRRQYLSDLEPYVQTYVQHIFPGTHSLVLTYLRGWSREKNFSQTLTEMLIKDRNVGHTQMGPHRADIRVRLDGVPVRARASRGEQKVIGMVLLLAQASLIKKKTDKSPIILIDDLAAELGNVYRERMFELLADLKLQSFVTFLDRNDIPRSATPSNMFHVEQGRVTAMV